MSSIRSSITIFVVAAIISFLSLTAPALAVQAKNIAVSRVEPGQAVLVVKTDLTTDVAVDYGTAPASYTFSSSSSASTRHEVSLTGLPSSSRVYYRVRMTNSADPADTLTVPEQSFSTFKAPGLPFSFTVAGDNRPPASSPVIQPAVWSTIIGQMAGESLDLALHSGDIINGIRTDTAVQNEEKYDALFDVTNGLTATVPLYTAAGNHEQIATATGRAGYQREFTLPVNNGADAPINGELYYSFNHGDTHFIILCTEIPGEYGLITGNQRLWLEEDLAADSSRWTVVVLHQPLFGQSGVLSHSADPWADPANTAGQQNRSEIAALFEQSGVDLVFSGHDHYYLHHSRNGVQYVITAGGGSPLYNLPAPVPGDIFAARTFHHVKVDETPSSMTVSAIDSSGAILERFTLGTPSLGLSTISAYWGSYVDFVARELSVDYALANNGSGDAVNVQVVYASATNGVFPLTATPVAAGGIAPGQSVPVTLRYLVPNGILFFRTNNYATCGGLDGSQYHFPGTPPVI